jgi:imidazolonepropionase-like amidohydrolase
MLMSRTIRIRAALAAATVLMLAGCSRPAPDAGVAATTVYFGGDIVTMVGAEPAYAEALAVRDGKILAVGTAAEVAKAAGSGAVRVDLAGRTLLPGFIDGHSHLLNYADSLVQANLNPPPIGGVTRLADIIAARSRIQASVVRTPLSRSAALSALAGGDVRLKLEGLASLARDLATPPAEAPRVAA